MAQEATSTLRYDRLSELVHLAVGEASMCWHEIPHGIFDDERARDVADKLIQDIRAEYEKGTICQVTS